MMYQFNMSKCIDLQKLFHILKILKSASQVRNTLQMLAAIVQTVHLHCLTLSGLKPSHLKHIKDRLTEEPGLRLGEALDP